MRPTGRVLVAASLLVTLVACGGNGGTSAPKQTTAARLPLTGQTVAGLPDRGVLVVKIDNTVASRPQIGLSSADLVVEELVEGGITRLAVLYQSKLPDLVGPVRSMRTTDIGIVTPTGGLLAASGGARITIRAVQAAGLHTVLPPNAGFFREGGRRAPYNLMLRPGRLTGELSRLDSPPDYLPWGTTASPSPAARPVRAATVRFSAARTVTWTYDGQRGWSRAPDLAAATDRFRPDTVLVLRVRTRDAGYRDPAGNPVPETILVGAGDALLLHAGTAVPGRWSKRSAAAAFALTDGSGAPLRVPPGHTWIELVPERGSVSTS